VCYGFPGGAYFAEVCSSRSENGRKTRRGEKEIIPFCRLSTEGKCIGFRTRVYLPRRENGFFDKEPNPPPPPPPILHPSRRVNVYVDGLADRWENRQTDKLYAKTSTRAWPPDRSIISENVYVEMIIRHRNSRHVIAKPTSLGFSQKTRTYICPADTIDDIPHCSFKIYCTRRNVAAYL